MTKDQIDFIFNQHGGRDKVIREKMFEIHFDNPRNYLPDAGKTPDERAADITFDDTHQLVIIKENGKMWDSYNDFFPTHTTLYLNYDDIQGIYIMDGKMEKLTIQGD